jgi:hypothetical protein
MGDAFGGRRLVVGSLTGNGGYVIDSRTLNQPAWHNNSITIEITIK